VLTNINLYVILYKFNAVQRLQHSIIYSFVSFDISNVINYHLNLQLKQRKGSPHFRRSSLFK